MYHKSTMAIWGKNISDNLGYRAHVRITEFKQNVNDICEGICWCVDDEPSL